MEVHTTNIYLIVAISPFFLFKELKGPNLLGIIKQIHLSKSQSGFLCLWFNRGGSLGWRKLLSTHCTVPYILAKAKSALKDLFLFFLNNLY